MSAGPLILKLVSASVAIVKRADKIIKDVMKKGELGIVQKGVNDLQTEADRSVQQCIVASLNRQFPNVAVIGEETLEEKDIPDDYVVLSMSEEVLAAKCPDNLKSVSEDDVVVWVDPLDGTSEYTQGLLDHVTILIGVAVGGKAVGGVIHQPYYNYQVPTGLKAPTLRQESVEKNPENMGRTVWSILGIGAFGIERVLPPSGRCIVATTRSHSNEIINEAVNAVEPDEVLRVGGAGHKVLMLVEGKAHAYVFASRGCKKWDTCAPEALLHTVGGKLTDIHGKSLHYDKEVQHVNAGGVLATYDASVQDSFLAKMPSKVLKALA